MRKIIAILLALLAIALTGCSDSAPDPPAESEESIHVAEVSPDGVLELSPCDGVFIQAPFPEIHAVQPYTSTFREFSIEEIQEVFCEKDSVVRTETAFNEITHFYELDSGETVYIMPGMFSYDNMESETQKNLIGLSPSCLVDLEDEASKAWYEIIFPRLPPRWNSRRSVLTVCRKRARSAWQKSRQIAWKTILPIENMWKRESFPISINGPTTMRV